MCCGPGCSNVAGSQLPLWRRARRRAYWALTLVVWTTAGWLPRRAGRAAGRVLARLAWFVRRGERSLARTNLALALPTATDGERAEILTRSVQLLGENLHDALAAPRLLAEQGLVSTATDRWDGSRVLDEELRALGRLGRGLVVLTGHFGCWELLGGWLARELPRLGIGPLAVVTGTIHNPAVDRLVQDRRRQLGMITLPRDGGARPLLRHLRSGGTAAILLDQNTHVPNMMVPFMGRPAPTAVGVAKIVLRYGIPVLPVAIARQGNGHVVRHRLPRVMAPNPAAADNDQELLALLTWCNQQLESFLRRNPAEWVWFHQRWP